MTVENVQTELTCILSTGRYFVAQLSGNVFQLNLEFEGI